MALNVSRRRMLKHGTVSAIGIGSLSISGCLSGGGADFIRVLGFGGASGDANKMSMEGWAEENDIEIRYTAKSGTPEFVSEVKRNEGEYDVAFLNDEGTSAYIQEDLVEPIDIGEIPNFEDNIRDSSHRQHWNTKDGDIVALPRDGGATGYAYNSDLVDFEMTSWQDIKDESLEGEISLLDRASDRFTNSATAIGVDINEVPGDDDLLDQVVEEVRAQHQNVFSYWSSGETHVEYLRNENAMATEAWGGRIYNLWQEGEYDHIEFVVPEEGALGWLGAGVIVKGSEKKDTVYDMLNHHYRRDVLEEYSREKGYAIQTLEDPPDFMTDFPDYAPLEELTVRDWSVQLPVLDDWQETFEEIKQE